MNPLMLFQKNLISFFINKLFQGFSPNCEYKCDNLMTISWYVCNSSPYLCSPGHWVIILQLFHCSICFENKQIISKPFHDQRHEFNVEQIILINRAVLLFIEVFKSFDRALTLSLLKIRIFCFFINKLISTSQYGIRQIGFPFFLFNLVSGSVSATSKTYKSVHFVIILLSIQLRGSTGIRSNYVKSKYLVNTNGIQNLYV